MPTAGWWEALWPDPASVLASVGLKPGMDVIDLCSGDGWFTLQIAKVARHVAAIDIDPTLLEVAQVRLKESGLSNCSFIAGDAYDLARLWPQPVDLVFMANAFHGVPDPQFSSGRPRKSLSRPHPSCVPGRAVAPLGTRLGRMSANRDGLKCSVWLPILIPSPALGRLSRFRPDSHTES